MVCEVGVKLENSAISNYFKSFCNFAKQGRLNVFEQKWNWTRRRQSTGISTVVRPSWLLILAVCWSSTTSIWPRSRVRMTCLVAFCSLTKQTRSMVRWRMRSSWKMPEKFWAQTKVKLDEDEEEERECVGCGPLESRFGQLVQTFNPRCKLFPPALVVSRSFCPNKSGWGFSLLQTLLGK